MGFPAMIDSREAKGHPFLDFGPCFLCRIEGCDFTELASLEVAFSP